MYQKSWLYAKLFLKYGVRRIQLLFFILGYFLLFYSPKNENFKTMKKKPGDIILLRKCTKNHDHMLYCSWDIVLEWCNCYFSFWAIFCPYTPPPLTARKMRKEKKNTWRYHFTQVYQKSWWCIVLFLRYVAWHVFFILGYF